LRDHSEAEERERKPEEGKEKGEKLRRKWIEGTAENTPS